MRLEAIDAFAGYQDELWSYVYDAVHIGAAEEIVPRLGRFDAILLADVVEHLNKDTAVQLIAQCLDHSSALVVSTPVTFFPQPGVNNNPYEAHRCSWRAADFPSAVSVVTIPARVCNIYVASKETLSAASLGQVTAQDLLYLQARHKLRRLGKFAWPIAASLRVLNRWLT